MALQKVGAGSFIMNDHIIPDTNSVYDLGNAEFKIRHLFLSDNSFWVGDNHKVDTSDGTYKTRKRKKGKVPQGVTNALIPSVYGDETALKAGFKTQIHDPNPAPILDPDDVANFNPPVNKWLEFMTLNGHPDKSADEIYDNGEDFEEEKTGVPSGVIVMWSGAIVNIPEGWQLCDGTNNTPDLRDRFVYGAGNTVNPNTTGGSTSTDAHTLTIAEMPAHTHSGQMGGGPRADGDNQKEVGSGTVTGSTGGGGSHTHTGTLPPYLALAFIMKLP